MSQIFACLTQDGGVVASDSRLSIPIPGAPPTDKFKRIYVLDPTKPVAFGVTGDWGSIDGVATWIIENQSQHDLSTCPKIADFVGEAYKKEFEKWHPKIEWVKYKVEGLFICGHSKGYSLGFMSYDQDFRPSWQTLRALTIGSYSVLTGQIITLFHELKSPPSTEEACRFACQFIKHVANEDKTVGGPIQLAVVSKSEAATPSKKDIARMCKEKSKLFKRLKL